MDRLTILMTCILLLCAGTLKVRAQNDPVLAGMILLYTDKAQKELKSQEKVMLLQTTGHISEHDMFNTFNMGVGMVLTVPAAQADKALEILHANGEPEAYKLGVIAEGDGVELC